MSPSLACPRPTSLPRVTTASGESSFRSVCIRMSYRCRILAAVARLNVASALSAPLHGAASYVFSSMAVMSKVCSIS